MASGLKSFVVQYRNAAGRSRRIVIGRYGLITVEEARREARALLGKVAKGIDPAEEGENARDAITVAEICDWYLAEAEAGRILGRRRRPIKASTLAMDRSRIEAHIKPLLGRRHVGTLTLGDIEGAQADIAAGKTAKPRTGEPWRGDHRWGKRRGTHHIGVSRDFRACRSAREDQEQPRQGRAPPRQRTSSPASRPRRDRETRDGHARGRNGGRALNRTCGDPPAAAHRLPTAGSTRPAARMA